VKSVVVSIVLIALHAPVALAEASPRRLLSEVSRARGTLLLEDNYELGEIRLATGRVFFSVRVVNPTDGVPVAAVRVFFSGDSFETFVERFELADFIAALDRIQSLKEQWKGTTRSMTNVSFTALGGLGIGLQHRDSTQVFSISAMPSIPIPANGEVRQLTYSLSDSQFGTLRDLLQKAEIKFVALGVK
jgi:hypothetical protein